MRFFEFNKSDTDLESALINILLNMKGDADEQDKATDISNFLHNVFWIEKYAEVNQANTYYCYSMEEIKHRELDKLNTLDTYTLANCWPYWDKFEQREQFDKPSLASDGMHYGIEHHERFANLFLSKFKYKLK